MLCVLCRMTNTLKQSNNSKKWNSKASSWFRTEAVRDHFNKTKDVKTMDDYAISIEKIRCGTYFIENEKKEGNLSTLCNEKVMSTLYWLYKEEVAHSKLNSLLGLLESLRVEEVATFNKKRSNRVLRGLLLILGSQVKENLLKRITQFPFFGILTDELNDLANIQNLVTSIKFCNEEK